VKKWPQNILGNLDKWKIDYYTGEAFMMAGAEQNFVELLRMNDPLQLVNLSRKDLWKLYERESSSPDFLNFELERYRRMVKLCLKDKLHADSKRMIFDGSVQQTISKVKIVKAKKKPK